ncbi:hypothetical protein D3C73_1448250 [compost metagenome]
MHWLKISLILRITCIQLQCHTLIRTHLNDKQIRFGAVALDSMSLTRWFFEFNDDACGFLLHSFTRTDVEWNTTPEEIINL